MSSVIFKIEVPEEALSTIIKQELQAFFANVQIPEQENDPEIMNLKEACKLTSNSKSLMYKLTASRQIPHSKRGKKLYFERKKLREWMIENEVSTQVEVRKDALSLLAKRRR